MAFNLFKKKKAKPEWEPVTLKGLRIFKNPMEAGEYALQIAHYWELQEVWAEGSPYIDKSGLMFLMEQASDEDFPYDYYVVKEADGSLGVLMGDLEEDPKADFHPEDIEWIALSEGTMEEVEEDGCCPRCGRPVRPADSFCTSCGWKLK